MQFSIYQAPLNGHATKQTGIKACLRTSICHSYDTSNPFAGLHFATCLLFDITISYLKRLDIILEKSSL